VGAVLRDLDVDEDTVRPDHAAHLEVAEATSVQICADPEVQLCRLIGPPREFPSRLDDGTISSYSSPVRRKEGALVPLEVSILEAALELRRRGATEAHGFLLAKAMRDERHAGHLTAYGTLYKALERLERVGYLESRWEDPLIAAGERRPRRRLYRVTLVGESALGRATENGRAATRPRSAAILPS
jgi:PadR family transcriptional regulator, regulatory protein PadR